ncbi:MAG: hypothetical protein ABIK28_11510, partial [Planctomycetota bacterium]
MRSREFHIIAGNHKDLFDQHVFNNYEHGKYVRLWLPLFPFPLMDYAVRRDKSPEEVVGELIDWGAPKEQEKESVSIVGQWKDGIIPPPPESIVFGTLELGYERENMHTLSLLPLATELATWCAAKAYLFSMNLYRTTLSGSLEAIGRSLASITDTRTKLTVAMPDWRTPVERIYPSESPWQVAIPFSTREILPPPHSPVRIEFDYPDPGFMSEDQAYVKEVDELLKASAKEAIRVAYRLDDYAAAPYLLVEKVDGNLEDMVYVGTSHPDPGLASILQEVCREARAEACTFFLFEGKQMQHRPYLSVSRFYRSTGPLRPIGPPCSRSPRQTEPSLTENAMEQAFKVAESKVPEYPTPDRSRGYPPAAILPLELADHTIVVLMLYYADGMTFDDEEKRDLEGRVARWTHRFSLRRMVAMNRFSTLMSRLRDRLVRAREKAARPGVKRHMDVMAMALLRHALVETYAYGIVLNIYSDSETEPNMVERFLCCQGTEAEYTRPIIDHHVFVDDPMDSPGRKALSKGDIIVYTPIDPLRMKETESVNKELLDWAEEEMKHGDHKHAERIKRIIALARGDEDRPSTMLVIPALSHGLGRDNKIGSITFFLQGEHDYCHFQRKLILEFG